MRDGAPPPPPPRNGEGSWRMSRSAPAMERGQGVRSCSRILIVGGGAREHALAWKIAQSPQMRRDHRRAGQRGHREQTFRNVASRRERRSTRSSRLAVAERVDLVVVGPEEPLARGLADALRARGIPCFGPGRDGAEIESSKAWAKELMHAAGVPTARRTVLLRSRTARSPHWRRLPIPSSSRRMGWRRARA